MTSGATNNDVERPSSSKKAKNEDSDKHPTETHTDKKKKKKNPCDEPVHMHVQLNPQRLQDFFAKCKTSSTETSKKEDDEDTVVLGQEPDRDEEATADVVSERGSPSPYAGDLRDPVAAAKTMASGDSDNEIDLLSSWFGGDQDEQDESDSSLSDSHDDEVEVTKNVSSLAIIDCCNGLWEL